MCVIAHICIDTPWEQMNTSLLLSSFSYFSVKNHSSVVEFANNISKISPTASFNHQLDIEMQYSLSSTEYLSGIKGRWPNQKKVFA